MSCLQVPLGEVVSFQRTTIDPSQIAEGTIYVGLEHIDGEGNFLSPPEIGNGDVASSKFTFGPADVLFGKLRPYLRKTARPSFSGVCSTDILPLSPGPRVDRDFLYHALRYQPFVDTVTARCSGANLPRISPSVLAEQTIPLPPLPEQRRIAAILDKADALSAKRREAIAKLDQLLQSVFLDMFGDPVTNPKGWPVGTLGSILKHAEVFTDGDWVESKDQDPNGDVRLIQLADVGDGIYIDKSHRFLTRTKAEQLRCTFLEPGDILVARMPDPLGRACIFPGDRLASVTVVDVCVIRPGSQGPNIHWLCAALNSSGVRNQIGRMATGTTRSRVSRGNLTKLELALPPVSMQETFAGIVGAIYQQRNHLLEATAKQEELFNSLQQSAFNGSP